MGTRTRRAAIAAAVVTLSSGVAGGVVAATRSSDEAALAPARQSADRGIERQVDGLLRRMTLDEKLQQVQLLSDGQMHGRRRAQRRRRRVQPHRPGSGSTSSSTSPSRSRGWTSRSCSPSTRSTATARSSRSRSAPPRASTRRWRPTTTGSARASRAAVGLKQIYSPMVDVSHEPRWGRISEAGGRGPVPELRVRRRAREGRAGPRLQRAGQGRHERQALRRLRPAGGRPRLRHDRHVRAAAAQPLPAAVQGRDRRRLGHGDVLVQRDQRRAGLRRTTTWRRDILKGEWGFDGFIESDYTAVAEMRACPPKNPDEGPCGHGTAADGPDAAAQALNAGTDSEMVSTFMRDNGRRAARRAAGSRCGGSTTPCGASCGSSSAPACSTTRTSTRLQAEAAQLQPDAVEAARKGAARSMVLLKNDGRPAAARPGQEDRRDRAARRQRARHARPVVGPRRRRRRRDGARRHPGAQTPDATFAQGCTVSNLEPPDYDPAQDCAGRRLRRGGRRRERRPTRSCSRSASRAR